MAAKRDGEKRGPGRPAREKEYLPLIEEVEDPVEFLTKVMNNSATEAHLRIAAAKSLLTHRGGSHKKGMGKKGERAAAAQEISEGGRFPVAAPPKLALVKPV